MSCIEVGIFKVCGKEARKLIFKQWKENRRKRLLLRLIREMRASRKELSK